MDIWSTWAMLHAKNTNYFKNVEDGWLFPYLHRLRGKNENLISISKINRMIFGCPPKVLHSMLFYSIVSTPWSSSPKATKYDEKTLELVKPYIKNIYGWSEKDFQQHKKIVIKLIGNKKFLNELNYHVSLEKKEAKALGIEFVKHKPKPKKEEKSISLANF